MEWIRHQEAEVELRIVLDVLDTAREQFEDLQRSKGRDAADYPPGEPSGELTHALELCEEFGDHPKDRHPRAWRPVRVFPILWWPSGTLFVFYADVGDRRLALLHLRHEPHPGSRSPSAPLEGWTEAVRRLNQRWGRMSA